MDGTRTRSRRGVALPVAVLATGAAGVILTAVAGIAWGLHIEAGAREKARLHEVRSAASAVARAAEQFLERHEQSALPRLLADAVATFDLGTCRVRVPNQETIADANSVMKPVGQIPDELPATARREESVRDGEITLILPVRVGTQGELSLEVSASVAAPWDSALARWGTPLVVASGLLGLLAAHRLIRARLTVLNAIGSALKAAQRQNDAEALAVSESLGVYATAWNGIVGERDAFRRYAALKDAAEPGNGGSVSSDLASACDAMAQGILILDDRLRVHYANGAAATLLGANRDDLLNSDVRKFVNDSAVIAAFEGVVSGKVRQRVSVEAIRVGPQGKSDASAERSGERAGSVLRFTARPVRREEQGVAMVVVEDVTQQKVADEARNSFVAQATHELRTPLTNIRLYTEAMIEDSDNAELRTKSLNVISSESRRLERIVSDMLSVSEIEAGTLKMVKGDVRLDQLFEELREDYAALAEDKEITLVFELSPKLPVILGDRDKLALSLHNLIANAIKYTPAGGKVVVRTEETTGQFLVHVVDNGIGVRKEEHDLIFDRFYRAKDARIANLTGTGLGLTLAREIARMHGGDIVVQSEIDKGSTFTLELPTSGPGAAPATGANGQAKAA